MTQSTLPEIGGDPEGLTSIGNAFTRAIGQLSDIGSGISQSGLAPWTGKTNEAFQTKLGVFHPHMGRVASALETAAGQLNQFAGRLDGYKSRNSGYHEQYNQQQGDLSQAQTAASAAANELSNQRTAQKQSLLGKAVGFVDHEVDAAVHAAESTWNDATKLVDAIAHDISDLIDTAWKDFDDFVRDAEAAASVIVAVTEDVGEIFFGAVSSVVNDVSIAASDEWSMITHPGRDLREIENFVDKHWQTIHTVLEYTSMVAGVVTAGVLVATGVGAPLGAAIMVGETAAFTDLEVGGDMYVARKGDTDASSREFAAESESGDLIDGVENMGLSAIGGFAGGDALDAGDQLVTHAATAASDTAGDSLDDLVRVTADGVQQAPGVVMKFGLGATSGLIDNDVSTLLNMTTTAIAPHLAHIATGASHDIAKMLSVPGVSPVLGQPTMFSTPLFV